MEFIIRKGIFMWNKNAIIISNLMEKESKRLMEYMESFVAKLNFTNTHCNQIQLALFWVVWSNTWSQEYWWKTLLVTNSWTTMTPQSTLINSLIVLKNLWLKGFSKENVDVICVFLFFGRNQSTALDDFVIHFSEFNIKV